MYFQFMKKGPLTGPSAKRKYLYNYACLILLLFLLGSKKSMAAPVQDTLVPVSGLVTDEKGDPFPGVTVYVPALKTGTASDANGHYQVKAPAKGTLIFKAVGFGTQELPVNGRSKITVKMEAENANLNEVVVTGYTSKRLSQVSSSVAVVTGKQLNDVTSNNVASLLQGKVAGVVVQNASGNPSVAANVTIRGSSSITAGSGPLYVVDGIVGGTANPNDIASVTILKDAAAAGLYGARASNGVIIITTKSGQAGKTQISLNSSVGFNKMSMGNMKLMNSQQLYDYQKSYFAPADFARDRPASLLSQNTDWMDLAYHTGLTQNHLLSVSGGSEKTQFYVSGNYYKEDGIIRHTSNEVYNLRANITHRINEKLKLTTRINAASRNFENEASGNYGALVLSKINLPWDNPYNADGSIKMGTEEGWIGREHDNFLHGWQFNYDKGKQLTTAADVNLDYYITPNLTFSTYNRVSYSNLRSELYYDVRSKAGRGLGELYNNSGYESKLITSNRLSYQRTFGEHALSAIVVAEGEKNYVENNSLYGNKIPAGLHIMDAAANIQQSPFGPGSKSENRFTKGLVQVDYTYREKYNLIGAYINEASSRFGANHRSAGFYTLGASWILSSEPFMKDQRLIDQLKIRASYGITGNAEIGDYQSLGIYAYTSQYASNPGSVPSVLQNPDLTWEKSKTTNIGLDIDLLKRITLTVDVYDKTTSALLLDVPVPYTSGYDYITRNVGSVRNRGIEFNLNTRNINSAHFKWETSFNLSINRNKVLKLNNREDIAYSSLQWISEGRDLYSWHMRKWAGVDAKNGDPLWEVVSTDANGKQTISTTNSYDDATLQYAGTASPDFTGGINNRFSWKGFTLSAFFNFVSGNQVYEENTNDGSEPTSNSRVLPKNHTRWQKEGDIATDPKAVYGGNKNSDLESSRFLQDGSYLRLRNVTFSYDVPESFLRRIKVNNARVFISGDNLWTLTGFSGMDPEMGLRPYAQPVGESGNNFQQNSTKYPLSKKVLVGINVTF